MIGRLCWLVTGVVLGVTGYRRASRLLRSLRPAAVPARPWRSIRPGVPPARLTRPAVHRSGTGALRGIGPFVHDVRDGMDLYLDRHSGQPGPTLGYPGTDNDYPETDNAKDG